MSSSQAWTYKELCELVLESQPFNTSSIQIAWADGFEAAMCCWGIIQFAESIRAHHERQLEAWDKWNDDFERSERWTR